MNDTLITVLNGMHSFFTFLKNQSLYAYIAFFVTTSLLLSLTLTFTGEKETASLLLKYTLIFGSIPIWYTLLHELTKGSFGVDIIAGVALIGTYIIEQYLAGVVVLLMLSGGQLFEVYAMARAKKELSKLMAHAPHIAHIKENDIIRDVAIEEVHIGMYVLIKAGEIISVDGIITEGETTVNESALTGESIPAQKRIGMSVFAGTENIDGVVIVRATKESNESRYHAIIKLVQHAEENKAPLVRLADTYSLYFTGITFVIGMIAWLISYDLTRVVAVLVVATPCPLLLATPIAIISGMSKASKKGIIIKDGIALETLARIQTFVFDKTGTLTIGTPEVAEIIGFKKNSKEKILTVAASLDQLSTHLLARALLSHAKDVNISLVYPEKFEEHFGDGIRGSVNGTMYTFGKRSFIEKLLPQASEELNTLYNHAVEKGMLVVFLANTRSLIGAIYFKDTPRHDASSLFTKLHREGISKTVMLTGDKQERAQAVADTLHITQVISECLPEDKLKHIKKFQKNNTLVAMVGDGVNDAPALARADVGIALGTHGQTAASDVADIVILSSSIMKVYDSVHIAKKTITLAKQGIYLGIGASTLAMIMSAFGYIPPLPGVILQEGIDVIVIINALSLGRMLNTHA